MYIHVDSLGNITSHSYTYRPDCIEINDASEWVALIEASAIDYKFINNNLEHHPRPTVYHAWDGVQWSMDQKLLKDARADMWERIKLYRQQRQYMGVQITITTNGVGTPYWIHSEEPSRSLHLGLVGAAILHILHVFFGVSSLPLFPSGLMWKTMQTDSNGQPIFIPLDYVVALQIFAADTDMTARCFTRAEAHRLAIEASLDPLNYDYTTNWPPVFGE